MPSRSRRVGHSRCRAGWTSSHWNSASSTEARVRSISRPCPSRRKSQKRRRRKRAWRCTPLAMDRCVDAGHDQTAAAACRPAAAPLPKHQGQAAFLALADRSRPTWLAHVPLKDVDLGGASALVPGGRLHPAYKITLPGDLDAVAPCSPTPLINGTTCCH